MLLVAVWLISAPLRARPSTPLAEHDDVRADLEAERDSVYAQIREAEMDHQAGKLTDEDFRALDSELRGEAIEILRRLDSL